jgi:hypothetical protein
MPKAKRQWPTFTCFGCHKQKRCARWRAHERGQREHRYGHAQKHCEACRPKYYEVVRAATAAMTTARNHGLIKKASNYMCADCDAPASVWEHRDYRLPLAVEPTCQSCNKKRGPGKWNHRHGPAFFLPRGFKTRPFLTGKSEFIDCAAVTLMGAA